MELWNDGDGFRDWEIADWGIEKDKLRISNNE